MEINTPLLIASIAIAFPYVLIITLYTAGWNLLKPKTARNGLDIFVSVVVAYRNEGSNLAKLLKCLAEQSYPPKNFEIVMVNDHSEDNSQQQIERFKKNSNIDIKILALKKGERSKKAAIRKGIENASGKLILTTDADCEMGKNWIESIVGFYKRSDAQLIVSPVKLNTASKLFDALQLIEFSALIGSTGGSLFYQKPLMCNGANLAFERAFYLKVNKRHLKESYASGDDVFLLLAAKKIKGAKVQFNKAKESIVQTRPQPNLKSFIMQRKRWVSKGKAYNDIWLLFNSAAVLAINAWVIFLLLYTLFAQINFMLFAIIVGIKFSVDLALTLSVMKWFRVLKHIIWYPLAQVFISPYIVFMAVYGSFGKYYWKGRRVK